MQWLTMRDPPAGNASAMEIHLELSGRIRPRRESMVIGRFSHRLCIRKSPSKRDRYNLGPSISKPLIQNLQTGFAWKTHVRLVSTRVYGVRIAYVTIRAYFNGRVYYARAFPLDRAYADTHWRTRVFLARYHATTRPRACAYAHNPIWLRIRTLPAPAAEDAACPAWPCSLSAPPILSCPLSPRLVQPSTDLPLLPGLTTSYLICLRLPVSSCLVWPCLVSSRLILSGPQCPPSSPLVLT
jgi:hypothetical protein